MYASKDALRHVVKDLLTMLMQKIMMVVAFPNESG
jgi:hypothetical protein